MAELELIGVPFDGYGRPGHQALAARVLRECGLLDAFGRHHLAVVDDLALPAPSPRRGPDTSLINEAALIALTDSLNRRIGGAVAEGRFPFVYGGDCSTLLGTMTGLRDHVGDVALVFVDGHEDTMPLDVSEDGEAANAEIGLLLGVTGRLLEGSLRARLPALRPELLAMLGPRDRSWRRAFNVGSLRDRGIWLSAADEVAADPSGAGRRTVEQVRQQADPWWLHVDLDVLDAEEFGAQGLPDVEDEPGGLTWTQLTDLLTAMVELGGCVGWSVVIYDPDQDPHRADARRIVELVRRVSGRLES
jgi:arginase